MITKKEIIKRLKENREILKQKEVKKIGIFGSAIKGKKNPKDIDVLVEFKKTNFNNYIALLFFLEKLFKKRVDLIIESDLRPELSYVKKEAEYVKI